MDPKGTFPPAGFTQTESKVAGIDVYMPQVEEQEEQAPVISFQCPRCGGTTAYNLQRKGLQCSYCGYVEEKDIEQVGEQAVENEFLLELMDQSGKGWGVVRQEIECQNCGAKITVSQEELSYTCPFCGSNKAILQAAEQPLIRPAYLIAFKVSKDQCMTIAREFMGRSWMTPGRLQDDVQFQRFIPIYFSFWTFDADLASNWKAQVGHTHQERYYDSSDRTWKTRTRIVWRWENGRVRLRCDDLVVPGTYRLSEKHLNEINRFNFAEFIEYTPSILAGYRALAYDVPLELAWEKARQVMREKARQACIAQASTSRIRNFNMNLDFSEERWRSVLLPLYLAAYSFSGKVYQVLINGQTGAVSGQRPVDWQKVWLVIAAILTPGILLSLIGFLTVPIVGFGLLPGMIGLFLLLVGSVISIVIGIHASQLDDA